MYICGREIFREAGNPGIGMWLKQDNLMNSKMFFACAAIVVAIGCGTSSDNPDNGNLEDVISADVNGGDVPADTNGTTDVVRDNPEPDVIVDTLEETIGDVIEQDTTDAMDDAADAGEDIPVVPEPPHALCGMPAYDLLPPGALGDLVESEQIPFLCLDADTINAILDEAKFSAMSPVPYGANTYRYRYTTQDRGQEVEATSILSYPVGAESFEEPLPVLLYLHGTTGFSDPCAPSYDENWMDAAALAPAVAALGFIVIAPDYIGMNGFGEPAEARHAYLVGEQVGLGSWDAVRGGIELLNSIDGHPSAMDKVALWGASQGGHAVLFSELWGPWYAPEFKVPGVVSLVPPHQLMTLMQVSISDIVNSTGLFLISLAATHLWYGGDPEQLDDIFTDVEPYYLASTISTMIYPTEECEIDIEGDIDDLTLQDAFTQDFIDAASTADWDNIGPWKCYYMENSLSSSSIPPARHTPTLMVYGQNDDLVLLSTQKDDFTTLCNMGYQLQYKECAGAGHTQAALWSMPEQFQWIRDRFAGVPIDAEDVCVFHEPEICSATPEPE